VTRAAATEKSTLALSGGFDSSTLMGLFSTDTKVATPRPVSLVFPGLSCNEEEEIRDVLHHNGISDWSRLDASYIDPLSFTGQLRRSVDGLIGGTLYHSCVIAQEAVREGCSVLFLGHVGDEWLFG